MSNITADIFSWFRSDPLPGLVRENAVIVGGTSLLTEFFSFVSEDRRAGSLAIAVPFVGDGLIGGSRMWESMNHHEIEVRMVVRRKQDVEAAIQQFSLFPWKSLQISRWYRLHAKMYAFTTGSGTGAALIGSHNLSLEGGFENHEAGVLMINRDPRLVGKAISDIHDDICELVRGSRLILDTTRWPAKYESERK